MAKFIFVILFSSFLLFRTSAGISFPTDIFRNEDFQKLFIDPIATKLALELAKGAEGSNYPVNPAARATLFPPLPDPMTTNATDIPLNITLDSDENPIVILGMLSLTDEGQVTGLSGLTDNFELAIIPLRPAEMTLRIDIPRRHFTGEYNMSIFMDLGTEVHELLGHGILNHGAENISFDAHALLKAAGNLAVLELELDMGFQNLLIDGGPNSTINGLPADWEFFSSSMQTWFDIVWTYNPEVKVLITEWVRCSLDGIIKDCTLSDLLIGNTDCLNFATNPDCFDGEQPSPTTGTPTTIGTTTFPTTTPPTESPPTTPPTTTTTTERPSCNLTPVFSRVYYISPLASWPTEGTTLHVNIFAEVDEGANISYDLVDAPGFLTLTAGNDILFLSDVSEGAYIGPNNVMAIEVSAFVTSQPQRKNSATLLLVFPKGTLSNDDMKVGNNTNLI